MEITSPDYETLDRHQHMIARNYIKRLSNLITLRRFTEAKELSAIFTGIIGLWEIQKTNIHNAAIKDGSVAQRNNANLAKQTIK